MKREREKRENEKGKGRKGRQRGKGKWKGKINTKGKNYGKKATIVVKKWRVTKGGKYNFQKGGGE
jgi:hypothetical protein